MLVSKKAKDINLLPESEATKGVNKAGPFMLFFAALVILAAALSVGATVLKVTAERENKDLQDSLSAKNQEWQKVASAAASLSQIKTKLSAYQVYRQQYPALVDYTSKLKDKLPSPASLKSLNLDNKGKANFQVEMSSPADAYQLANLLNQDTTFSDVKLLSISKTGEGSKYLINIVLTIKK